METIPPAQTTPRTLPPEPPDEIGIRELGDRIAELSALLSATEYQLLVLIREFDERYGWRGGFRSCAHWLNWRTGLAMGSAREKVRVARALGELPLLSEAMRDGELSFSKVRALTRVATPETEESLLGFARAGTAAHVERLVRAWRRVGLDEDTESEAMRHADRHLSLMTDEHGMVVVRGLLDPEVGAVLARAIEAAEQVLFDERAGGDGWGAGDGSEAQAPRPRLAGAPQRRADAIGRLAEAALAGGLDQGTRGDRYQVVVHVEAAPDREEEGWAAQDGCCREERDGCCGETSERTSSSGRENPGRGDFAPATIEGVTRAPQGVSAETSRRLACDASRVVMTHDDTGTILDVGRRTRAVSPGLRRALEHRDGGCRFPGCGLAFCDAHHVEHWADGGETKLDNLVLLCRRHHRAVHEQGYAVEIDEDGSVSFRDPFGRVIPDAPSPPPLVERPPSPEAATQLLTQLLGEQAVEVDPEASLPEWRGERFDRGWALDALMN